MKLVEVGLQLRARLDAARSQSRKQRRPTRARRWRYGERADAVLSVRSLAFAWLSTLVARLLSLGHVAELGGLFALARVPGATVSVGLAAAIALLLVATDSAGATVRTGLTLSLALTARVAGIAGKACSTVGLGLALAADRALAASCWLLRRWRAATTGDDKDERSERGCDYRFPHVGLHWVW